MAIDDPLTDAVKATIKKQMEFYFSDSNAARDKFLLEKIESHPEGFVELALLCSFTRMSKALELPLGQSAAEIPNAIIAKVAGALEGSETLELSEDRQFVKRKVPLESREMIIQQTDSRTIIAKPLPFDASLDTLTEFFGTVGKVVTVRMRRHSDSKDFKGSVFVEFDTDETAEKVMAREDIEFEGAILRLERKMDYVARKKSERQGAAAANIGQRVHVQRPKPPADAPGDQDGATAAPMDATSTPAKPEAGADGAPATATPAHFTPNFQPGTVLRFKVKEGQDLSKLYFMEIKNSLGGREGGVTFVEYNKGSDSGFVRYREAAAAEKMLTDSAEGLKIQELDASLEKVSEEEEKEFYEKALQAIRNSEKQKQPGGGYFHVDNKRKSLNQRGRGRGGRFGKRGRMS